MKLVDVINYDSKISKVQSLTRKKKKNKNAVAETDPHISNVDVHYGMSASPDAVIQS